MFYVEITLVLKKDSKNQNLMMFKIKSTSDRRADGCARSESVRAEKCPHSPAGF